MSRLPTGMAATRRWTVHRLGARCVRGRRTAAAVCSLLAVALLAPAVGSQEVDSGAIRLGRPEGSRPNRSSAAEPERDLDQHFRGVRRGFNYESFKSRLETLWFQRKAFLADGRDNDAIRQAEVIRAFCTAEGVRRLDSMAGALLAEAGRYVKEGHYGKALQAIDLAEALDPGRPQASLARAVVFWKSRRGYLRSAAQFLHGVRLSFVRAAQDLSLINRLVVILVLGCLGGIVAFSLLMLFRYHVPLRHGVEEWMIQRDLGHWGSAAGWGVVLLPLLAWAGAGWCALYWIVITLRYMRSRERVVGLALLVLTGLSVPAYRAGVALYGVTSDPVVRTTVASAGGAYDPDRIVKLRQLVDAYPDDPIYRFLLAGLYRNGRYFEEAFEQYKHVLTLQPSLYQAEINIGNIFHLTDQHGEAVSSYRRALEVKPDSVLAYYNMHLAQSESFHFKEAEASLDRARAINPKATSRIMEAARSGDQATTLDASVKLGSIWQAALEGRGLRQRMEFEPADGLGLSLLRQFLNPVSLVAFAALAVGGLLLAMFAGSDPARRCIRCGRPFCHYCKRGRQGHEYCSQCLHLFVVGDGLAPETKTRKLYEIERYERWNRNARGLVSLVLPGSVQLLRGRAGLGVVMMIGWFAALVSWQPLLLRPLERVLGFDLRLDLLDAVQVPALFRLNPTVALAAVVAVALWLGGNAWRWRRARS